MTDYVSLLAQGFNSHVAVREKRPGLMKLLVPLYHEDGDMLDLFVERLPDGHTRITDRGLSLMRLSYSFDIDTDNKQRIFRRILSENHIQENNGELFIDAVTERLYPAVLQFGQAVAKVSSMALYRREVIANLFYEMLNTDVLARLSRYKPQENIAPLEDREELTVDYRLEAANSTIFLFGIKERDIAKLRLVAVSCLEFERKQVNFKSVVVHQDFEALSKLDRKIITNAADKQFTSLAQFEELGEKAIERLAA